MSQTRHILITGAAQGIGRAVAERFGQEPGNRLILLDRDSAALGQWLETAGLAAEVHAHAADIADLEGLRTLFRELERRHGHVDVLVNSAGICDENEPEDIAAWHKVIAVNLHGSFYVCALAQPLLADGGRIINMASILGRAGKQRNTAYCASKHGLVGMTKALALDLAPRRITVNAILPAWIDTPMLQQELALQASTAGLSLEQIQRNARKKLPLRRFIESEEVAALAHYLASPEAAGLTAQSLVLDGGVGLGM
ncbi:MAG: SDR family oxidoreductase [Gammaproteobacteria bacterium]|nr:SDR family oxidoreductase [Gammaproteobacteria bacterium]